MYTHTNMNTTPSALNMSSTQHQLASDPHQCINSTKNRKKEQNSKSKMALNDCPFLTAYYVFLFCCCSPLITIKWSINRKAVKLIL